MGISIGCNNLFETTFEKEVYSDLTGERCVLMGLIQGAFKAQYDVLRENGHSPLEAYNETIEEALEHLYPMISEKEWTGYTKIVQLLLKLVLLSGLKNLKKYLNR